MSSSAGEWPDGVDRVVLPEVDSTNAEARRRSHMMAVPTWILGLRQTQGRGRRGRAWSDPSGNFAATLALRPPGGPQEWALRSFVAALALRDALDSLTGARADLSLKWPNDVLLCDAKVAGILLETEADGLLCIGIGVNLIAAPDASELEAGAVAPSSVLDATGVRIAPETLLDALAPEFAAWDARLQQFGFVPLRDAFLAKAARRGTEVMVRTTRDSIKGRFTDIDTSGAIVLDTPDGRVAIPAGDVFF